MVSQPGADCSGFNFIIQLDVFDQRQTFRYLVTSLAMTSPCVLDGVLKLSAMCSGLPVEVVERRGVGALHLRAMFSLTEAEVTVPDVRLTVSFALVRTLLFAEAIPDSWQDTFHGEGPYSSFYKVDSVDPTRRRIWLSSLVLIWRLGTSQANPILSQTFTLDHHELSLG